MTGVNTPANKESLESDATLVTESADLEEEDDVDHTVEELSALVLAASSAPEAAAPLPSTIEFNCNPGGGEDPVAPELPPATVAFTTRSGRARRRSSRYREADWAEH